VAVITVGTYEAKTHLPRLLEKVCGGETITITRHGKPIAQLVPIGGKSGHSKTEIDFVEQFRKLRRKIKPGGPSIRELIDAGRRT
jgi:prevent-host-death family protein